MNSLAFTLASIAVTALVLGGCGDDSGSGGATGSTSSVTTAPSATATSSTGAASCGDAVVDTGEECDLGSANDDAGACTTACKTAACGDGLVQTGVEACDDHNTVDGDGCESDCVESGSVVWQTIYDGPGMETDGGIAVALDSAGNILVAGTQSVTNQGLDILLRKYDPTGTTAIWTRTHDGLAHLSDVGLGVAVDALDNVVVVGTAWPDTTSTNSFVRMYDADGNTLWTAIGDLSDARAVTFDNNGDVIVAGSVGGEIAWARFAAADGMRTFLQQLALGTLSSSYGVAVDSNDEIIVAGSVENASSDGIIYKFGNLGGVVWSLDFDGAAAGIDQWNDVVVDAADNVIVAGFEEATDVDLRVNAYDPTGQNLLFESTVANTGSDAAAGLHIDGQGNLLVCGALAVPGQAANIWFEKLSPAGATLWTSVLDGPPDQNELCSALTTAANGDIVAVGSVNDDADLWVAELTP